MAKNRSEVPSNRAWPVLLSWAVASIWFFLPAVNLAQHQHGPAGEKPPMLLKGLGTHTHYPLRESLGGALLRASQAERAEAVFREGLRRTPRDGRLLFGLMESLKAQSKNYAAEMVRKEFERAWKTADVILRVADL